MSETGETPLVGGAKSTGVVRVGDTVRRPSHHRSGYVQGLLAHLERVGFEGAPRPLGFDEQGREIVSYVEGEVLRQTPLDLSDSQLRSATLLVRGFHDATAGSAFAGDAEVVCHRDLGSHNTVFRGESAVAIIDWDADVGPGRRSADFADAVWGFADLTDRTVPVLEQARRAQLMCASYPTMTTAIVIDELTDYFSRCRSRHAAAQHSGPVAAFDDLLAWIHRHGGSISQAP